MQQQIEAFSNAPQNKMAANESVTPEKTKFSNWIGGFLGSEKKLLANQLKGLVPFLLKSLQPLVNVLLKFLDKVKSVTINYLQALPTENMSIAQRNFVELFVKILNFKYFNYDTLNTIVTILFNTLISFF